MSFSKKKLITNITEATNLTGPFKGEDVLIPWISMIPTVMSFQFKRLQFPILLAITINKAQAQSFRILWLIFTHWLLLTWANICCLFQSCQSRQSLYLHRKWNYQKYCVSTSIGKLNIWETCISSPPPFKQTEPCIYFLRVQYTPIIHLMFVNGFSMRCVW